MSFSEHYKTEKFTYVFFEKATKKSVSVEARKKVSFCGTITKAIEGG
jgi:hypothetical protein